MSERIEAFWDALGRLTFAELVEVAETFRDAHDATTEFEVSDVQDWSFLLNSAREVAVGQDEAA
jgi:hypothetical protein